LRSLKMTEAAALLGVTPNTLRAWERRYEFPSPERAPGKHRLFRYAEVAALRNALEDGLSVSAAVSRARENLPALDSSLVTALVCCDRDRADAVAAAALGSGSLERAVEDVILPALAQIADRHTVDSAAWAFAAPWAADWLRRARRLAEPAVRSVSILIGDASRDELDRDAPYIRALELLCASVGITVLSMSPRGTAGIGRVVAAHRPDLVVVAGGSLPDDTIAKWMFGIRGAAGAVPVLMYRPWSNQEPLSMTGATELPAAPGDAKRCLLDRVTAERSTSPPPRRTRPQHSEEVRSHDPSHRVPVRQPGRALLVRSTTSIR
jgi:MerR family transcriptional regulator, light-induced transcriptional regulator